MSRPTGLGTAPGPRGHPLLGALPQLNHDPLAFLGAAWREHGDVVRLRLGGGPLGVVGHLVVHPADVQHVLVERQRDYALSTGYEVLRTILGEGLLTSHGERWRQRRRLLQPAFRPARLSRVASLVSAAAADGMESLERAADTGEPFDLYGAMAAITLDAMGRAMFSADVATAAAVVGPALRTAQEFTIGVLYSPAGMVLRSQVHRLPTPAARRYRRAVARLDVVVEGIVAGRRDARTDGRNSLDGSDSSDSTDSLDGTDGTERPAPDEDDILGLLLAAEPVDGGPLTSAEIRDEVLTFLLAGHETTAGALTWTLALLSRNPGVRADLHDELAAVLGGRQPGLDDLDRLPLLDAVVSESLRLYPPAWLLERQAACDDEIGGRPIPAGSTVIMSPYLTHRHPDFWANPEGFEPGRWLAGGPRRPRTAYFPFGAGPRQCIGGAFALMEAKLVLATLVQRVDIDLLPGEAIAPVPRITLTAGAGLSVRARRR